MDSPRVSIGLPVYNGENFVAEAIESILAQTYTDYELIISDNGSTDRTQAICEGYAAQDARVKYFRSEVNRGAGWNFNRVLELAQGDAFKWLAHDDLIAPAYLEKCAAVLEADPEVVLAYPQVAIVDENKALIEKYGIKLRSDSPDPLIRFQDLVLAWSLCFEVFGLIRIRPLRETGGMGNFGHGDGVLLAHLGLLGRFVEVPEVMAYARKHARQSLRMFGLSEAGGNNYHLYTQWFDPRQANRLIFPNWKIALEYCRSVNRGNLSLRQKATCYFTIVRWMRRNVRHLLHDLIVAVQFIYGRLSVRGKRVARPTM